MKENLHHEEKGENCEHGYRKYTPENNIQFNFFYFDIDRMF